MAGTAQRLPTSPEATGAAVYSSERLAAWVMVDYYGNKTQLKTTYYINGTYTAMYSKSWI